MAKYRIIRFPPVPEELLKALEATFPDRLPAAPTSSERVAELVGQQQVIRLMRRHYNEQNNINEDTE